MKINYNTFWSLRNKYLMNYVEITECIFYSLIAFSLPLILGHPQWLVGVIVNAVLIRCAINFRFSTTLPVIIFPSLGVLCAGIIFGQSTHYLLYFIPIIWLGNFVYVFSYKYFAFKKKILSWWCPTISAFLKAGILFGSAAIMVFCFDFPAMFLTAMGAMQLATALAGGYIGMISAKII
jgi:hypothetical protein